MTHHTTGEAKGRIKESLGVLTDDKGLEREGKIDKGAARAQKKIEEASEKAKKAVNPKR